MDQRGRREPNPTCCPLTSTNVLSQVRARVPSQTHPIVIKQTTTEKTPSQTMYTMLSVHIWVLPEESLIHTRVQQKRAEIKNFVLVYLPYFKKKWHSSCT